MNKAQGDEGHERCPHTCALECVAVERNLLAEHIKHRGLHASCGYTCPAHSQLIPRQECALRVLVVFDKSAELELAEDPYEGSYMSVKNSAEWDRIRSVCLTVPGGLPGYQKTTSTPQSAVCYDWVSEPLHSIWMADKAM
jgi:hypothetical protein